MCTCTDRAREEISATVIRICSIYLAATKFHIHVYIIKAKKKKRRYVYPKVLVNWLTFFL